MLHPAWHFIRCTLHTEKAGLKLNIQNTKISTSGSNTSWQIDEETMETVTDLYFLGLQDHYRWWLQLWNWKVLSPWKKSCDQPRQHIKKQRHHFANKTPCSQSYGLSSSQCMDVKVGLWRKLSAEELMLLTCGVGEDSWESLGLQGDPTSPS